MPTSPKFRSRFEERVFRALPKGTEHEPHKFRFAIADPGYRCRGCGSKEVERTTSYVPDFRLPNKTWIEAKGRLTAPNRRRLVAFKAAFPDVTLRIVFMADNLLYRGAASRYSDWAKKAGFEYCVGISNIDPRWTKHDD